MESSTTSARSSARAPSPLIRSAISRVLLRPVAGRHSTSCRAHVHHLTKEAKQQTTAEVARVLRSGGELRVADWRRPSDPVMGLLVASVRAVDGLEQTRANGRGGCRRSSSRADSRPRRRPTACVRCSEPCRSIAPGARLREKSLPDIRRVVIARFSARARSSGGPCSRPGTACPRASAGRRHRRCPSAARPPRRRCDPCSRRP